VPTGEAGPAVAFTERAGVDPATGRLLMFLRVAQIGAAGPAPRLRLSIGAGPAAEVGTAQVPVHDNQGTLVALATGTDEPDALTLVEVEILRPGSSWHLQILNRDAADHHYVWVVADTADGTRRPWLDLPVAALAFQAVVGQAAPPQDLTIANHGPGPLTLDDPDRTDLGAGFTLLDITPRPIDGNRTGTARIGFTPPAAPATVVVQHTLTGNDAAAGAVEGHRNRVTLTATVTHRVPWSAGDVLALVGHRLCRLNRATGALAEVLDDPVPAVALAVSPLDGAAFLLVGNTQILRVDPGTGVQTLLTHPLGSPRSLAVDRIGTLCVLGSDSHAPAVVRVDHPTGKEVSRVALPGEPRAVAAERSGDLVVVEFGYGNASIVARVAAASGQRTVLSFSGLLTGGEGRGGLVAVAVDPVGGIAVLRDGRLLNGPSVRGLVARINAISGEQTGLVARDELADPAGIAVEADGTLLVSCAQGLFAITFDPSRLPVDQVPRRLSAVPGVTGIAIVPPPGTF
jgi:hypothetical protein